MANGSLVIRVDGRADLVRDMGKGQSRADL